MAASIQHRLWPPSSQTNKENIPDTWPRSEAKEPSSFATDPADLGHRSILDLMMPPAASYPQPHPAPFTAVLPHGHGAPQKHHSNHDRDASTQANAAVTTLDLLGCLKPSTSTSESTIELDSGSPPPSGWEKCLDLKTGTIYYVNKSNGVSSSDIGKAFLKSKVDPNWSSSPATSELTAEASLDAKVSLSPLALGSASDSKRRSTTESGSVDLSLNLHLGLRTATAATSSPKALPIDDSCLKSFYSPRNLGASNASSRVVKVSALSSSTSTSSSAASPGESVGHNRDATKVHAFKIQDLFKSSEHKVNSHQKQVCVEEGKRKLEYASVRQRSPFVNEGLAADEAMITVGCGNCLMFVMLSRSNSKCPRCGTCLLLEAQPAIDAKRPKLGFSL